MYTCEVSTKLARCQLGWAGRQLRRAGAGQLRLLSITIQLQSLRCAPPCPSSTLLRTDKLHITQQIKLTLVSGCLFYYLARTQNFHQLQCLVICFFDIFSIISMCISDAVLVTVKLWPKLSRGPALGSRSSQYEDQQQIISRYVKWKHAQ